MKIQADFFAKKEYNIDKIFIFSIFF